MKHNTMKIEEVIKILEDRIEVLVNSCALVGVYHVDYVPMIHSVNELKEFLKKIKLETGL